MPPTYPLGPADGHQHSQRPLAPPSSGSAPPARSAVPVSSLIDISPSTSPSLEPLRRRKRVDSSSFPAGASTKRTRLAPSLPLGHAALEASSAAARPVMSAKAFGKQPEIVDLTGDGPSSPPHLLSSQPPWKTFTASTLPPQQPLAFQPLAGAKKLVIKNLRVSSETRMGEVNRYYERTWAEIDDALRCIFAGRPPRQPLERIYRGVENVCLHGQAERLYRRLHKICETHLSTVVLEQILTDMRGRSNVDVLRVVHRQWLTWSKQATIIRSTFSYLDKSYLVNERSLQQIDGMLIARFRRMVFERRISVDSAPATVAPSGAPVTGDTPGRQVLAGMVELVDQARNGEAAFDAYLLREAVSMMHVFGVYGQYFEPLFLQESEAYMQDFAQERETVGLRQYIQECDALLRHESERCTAFNMDTSTKKSLLQTAHRLLIYEKASKLLEAESVVRLLDANDVASMQALYELLVLSAIQRRLRTPWEAYIAKMGIAIVTDVARGDEMVVRLLLLRRNLDVMVRDAFQRDEHFVYGLRQAFGQFVNDRQVAAAWEASGSGNASKVGEMVAKYIDMLLRGGLKTLPPALLSDKKDRAVAERSGQASAGDEDAELDRQLDNALELFRFIEGKDVFEAFYKKDLARRLLMGRSASHDAERNMLSKLKVECGSSLTHNLEQMFRDQQLSREEMTAYKRWLETTGRGGGGNMDDDDENGGGRSGRNGRNGRSCHPKVDLQVSVLSAAAWPTYREVTLNLPAAVVSEVDRFDRFYKSKHTGRQLTWMHVLSHCVVKARFPKGVKELLVSSFQAAVLLLFNQVEEGGGGGGSDGVLSYEQIAASTGLEGGDLDRTLQSLACGKVRVLSKHPKGREVAATDTFTVNRGFADAKVRIKINQIQLKETRDENKETYERVAADRQFETQAAIVRIMKSRKSLGHAQLVAEVISQTKSRGSLDPAEIKQNIEKLIEKDYLEREDGKYVYLA